MLRQTAYNGARMNRFQATAALGYAHLIPIIPPGAPISEHSSLHGRVDTPQDARGKSPGLKGPDGDWRGMDWIPYQGDEKDLERWHDWGAGVGIKTGHGLVAVDADTLDEANARTIKEAIERHIGQTPIRVGQFPKALYPVRVSDPVPYQRIEFGPVSEKGSHRIWRVELLTEGRQFVAYGVHPKTREPYYWPRELVPFDDLPLVSPETLEALLADLRETLPDCGAVIKEGATAEVDQASLRGDPETVRRAVEALPNTSEAFPSREAYRDVGYAIKASIPDDPETAFDIWWEWCERWQGPNPGDVNSLNIARADWSRMHPEYRRGASWLYELADKHSGGAFTWADVWLDDLEENPNPFAEIAAAENAERGADLFPVLTIDAIRSRPPAEWLIERHLPKHGVGFLYSQPGAGKSFMALDMALHIAAGSDEWNGDPIHQGEQPRVLYIAAEGAYGFRNRIDAWMQTNPGRDARRSFYLIEQTINFMDAEDVEKLARTVRSVGPDFELVIVDTVSRAMPGADENLQKDMTRFIQACDAVRTVSGGVVLGVHHAGKSGDMRGSTVLLGAGDFVFRLDRERGATVGTLTCEKQKEAPDGWHEPYEFSLAQLEDGETSLVVSRCDVSVGPSVELTPALVEQVMAAMRAAWDAGEPWGRSAQSGERRATRRMVSDFGITAERADELLTIWQQMGLIAYRQVDSRTKRKGFCVLANENRAASLVGSGPFEPDDIFA